MIQRHRFRHFAINAQFPRIGFQPAGVGGRIGFVETKFVEVVVAGDFIFRRQRQVRLPLGRFAELQIASGRRRRPVIALKPAQHIGLCAAGQAGRGSA